MFPVSGPRGPRPARLLQPAPPDVKCVPVPAPNSGINAVDGLLSMGETSPQDSIFQYNLIPSQYGTKVRSGYREWATNVGAGGVRTVIPFTGAVAANNKLFAAASGGIYDVSLTVNNPAASIAFGTIDVTSGVGCAFSFTTIAGHFELYCDESNGYYTYAEAGAWLKVTLGGGANQVSGVDPALFVWGTIYKSKAWFVEKNSSRAWYLPTGSIYGAATLFDFGNKFKAGGYLVALYNWTVDGGEGTDDYLVAISSAGDVVLYKGNDPAVATDFLQKGIWFIGSTPAGRRVAGNFGGELYIISTYGVVPLTKLIAGALIQQEDIYLSKKITPLINNTMLFTASSLGWEIKLIPAENLLLLSSPKRIGFDYIQFVQSLNTNGWAVYRDLPYFTGENWLGTFYFGDTTGRVLIHDGTVDNTSRAGVLGVNIEWSCLSVFREYGEIGIYKRAKFIRPVFLASKAPAFSVSARYDYNLDEVLPPATSGASSSGSLWDVAIWDTSLWGGEFIELEAPIGAYGMGRAVAIGLNGNSAVETILIRYDLMYDSGGML